MLTIKFWRFLCRLYREDKSFELGAMGAVILIGFTYGAPITIPLIGIDLGIWFVVRCMKRMRAQAIRRAEMAEQQRQDQIARKTAQAAEQARALARLESDKLAEQERLRAAQEAVELAVNDIRRHWANCFELIGERCPLKDMNDAIDRAVADPSPHTALRQLAEFKDSMTRDAVRIRTEQLYESVAPYLSSIVPRVEFDRLMREAVRRSTNVTEYGNRLRELGGWLESLAGPARGRWENTRQREQIAAYERLFADGGSDAEENPFQESVEERRGARAG